MKHNPTPKYTILLVDNRPMMRKYLATLLEKAIEDAEVIKARNGLTALEIVKKQNPNLTITDYRLCGIDGARLINASREHGYSNPIFLMAGTKLHEVKVGIMEHNVPHKDVRFYSKATDLEKMIYDTKKYLENLSAK